MTDKLKWTTVTKRIEQLVPYGKNPRRLTDKQYNDLKASLTKFSLAEIPVIDADGVIIAGHMRLKVLAEIESPQFEVDVRVPNRKLTEKDSKNITFGQIKTRENLTLTYLQMSLRLRT